MNTTTVTPQSVADRLGVDHAVHLDSQVVIVYTLAVLLGVHMNWQPMALTGVSGRSLARWG